jgi:hypothetical protein
VDSKLLSDAQMETVIYASMKFHGPRLADGKRHGFFLGDGAGVGKGRQIAALAKQHFLEGGTRVLWISVSNDLRLDAQRDLDDVNADIAVCPVPKASAFCIYSCTPVPTISPFSLCVRCFCKALLSR